MATHTIKHINGTELWSGEAASTRDALEKAVVAGANLVGANLDGAYLVGADLDGAYLVGADLSGANLSGAEGIDYCIGGWSLQYVWTCLRRPGQEPTLRYGCETRELAGWTEEWIVALSAKHEPSTADRYAAMLRGLVAWCRTHDALWPVAVASRAGDGEGA